MDVLKFIGGINNDYEKNGKNEETETSYNENNNKLVNQEMEKIKYVSNNYKVHWRERHRIEKLDAKEKDLEKEFYKREKEWLELEEQIKKDTYKEWNKFMQAKKKDIAKLIELDLKGENEDSSMSSSKRRESRRSKRAKEKKLDEQDRLDEVKELEEAKKKPEQIKDIDTTKKEKEETVEKNDKQNSDNTSQVKAKKSGFFATAFSYVFDNSKDKQDDEANEDKAKDDSEKEENNTKQLNQNEDEKNENSEVEKENDEYNEDKENNTNKKKSPKSKRKIANSETEKANDKKKKAASENAQEEEEDNDKSSKKVRGRNKKSSNTEDDENTIDIESLKNDPIIAYELETAFPKKRRGKNDTAKTIDIIKKSAKILEKIPSEEEDIFNYPIEWDILKLKDNISTKLKPWIYKKITEYIGADEKEVIEEISNFFVEQILKETAPKDMLSEAEKFLDSDGKKFIINMYRLIVFEQLKIKNNM
ncbi:RNA-binding protein 25, putative [Plasmodium vinckei lentum]|uniref:RNA-binding protein 25, putative n=1 Tax=Plasmodium vinckei lentum TaxID=138297 RepID=A0A6V7RTQ0_PLAVN|nr:RNA-binding protein 25, putative [Plasmodium vinckei lentum]